MSDKIAYDYMRLHAPTRAGMFVMVDHPECGDSRHRLWLKRNINGSVMGYCHNCGGRAYLSPHLAKFTPSAPPIIESAAKLPLPNSELVSDPVQWPAAARGWLLQYGIEPSYAGAHWWPRGERLALEVRNYDGQLIGHNMRSIDGRTPKYLFQGKGNEGHWVRFNGGPLVIVEDILSATKVGRFTDSVALLRTHMSPEVLAKAQKYSAALVWMDPDKAGWEAAAKVVDQLTMFTDVGVVNSPHQPKEATDEEIRDAIFDSSSD